MSNKPKRQRLQSLHLINVCVTVLTLIAVGVLALVLPKPTVSEVERRELAKKPEFTLESWFSGEFAQQYDAYYADTFPQREELVTMASKIESMEGIRPDDVRIYQANSSPQQGTEQPATPQQPSDTQSEEVTVGESQDAQQAEQPAEEQQPTIDYDSYDDPNAPGNGLSQEGTDGEQAGNLFLYKNMGMQIFGSSESLSKRYAQVINSYAEDLDGVQVYSLIAPTSIEFYLPEGYEGIASSQRENIDYVAANLSEQVKVVDAYSEIEKNKDEYLYFRTDHHWTVRGAYQAYIAFCKTAGLTPVSLEEMEHHQIDGFLGTFYSQTHDQQLAATPDFVEYFVPPVEYTAWRYSTGSPYTPVESSLFASYATSGPNTYSVFLHGDFPLLHVQTGNNTGRKIMIIKESFGNAFAPFLVSHYDDVYIVDQRYFELGVEDFVRENGITDLLFLNNIFAVNTGVRIDELQGIQNQTYTAPATVQQPAQQTTEQQQETEEQQQQTQQPAQQTADEPEESPPETQTDQQEEQEWWEQKLRRRLGG